MKVQTVAMGSAAKPDIRFEVFLHKVDGLSDETKMDTQREIVTRWSEEALEAGLGEPGTQVFNLQFFSSHLIKYSRNSQ